jgi:hypothetical protein
MGKVERDKALHIYKKKGVLPNPDVWQKYQSLASTFEDQIGSVSKLSKSPPKTAQRYNRKRFALNESSIEMTEESIIPMSWKSPQKVLMS